jgi:methylthioribulose-1-phosphate dehydratase
MTATPATSSPATSSPSLPLPSLALPSLAETFAAYIRQWNANGWTPASSSNFSIQGGIDAGGFDGFWVSRSGVNKAEYAQTDFIQVNPHGQPLNPETTPSAETLLHAAIYQQWPEVKVVAHTHSPAITVLSRLWVEQHHKTDWQISGYELQKGFEGQQSHLPTLTVPLIANSQHMPDIATPLSAWLANWQHATCAPGFIIVGHGLYTWAHSLEALNRHVEAFEFLAQCTLEYLHYGHTLPTPHPTTPA